MIVSHQACTTIFQITTQQQMGYLVPTIIFSVLRIWNFTKTEIQPRGKMYKIGHNKFRNKCRLIVQRTDCVERPLLCKLPRQETCHF